MLCGIVACADHLAWRVHNNEKAFFTHIDQPMRTMAAELRAGRAPANIMYYLAQEELELQRRLAHTGRNDPCPCGSNRKFKKCHGK